MSTVSSIPPNRPRPFQFSLRQLLLAVTLACPVIAVLGGAFGRVAQIWAGAVLVAVAGIGIMFPLFLAFDWYFSNVAWILAVLAGRSPGANRRRPTRFRLHRPLGTAPRGGMPRLLLPFLLHALLSVITVLALGTSASGILGEGAEEFARNAVGLLFVVSGMIVMGFLVSASLVSLSVPLAIVRYGFRAIRTWLHNRRGLKIIVRSATYPADANSGFSAES